ncbi:MAG TPA: hypothetical protein VMR33_19535 [Candidatus Baltobacteraceae bacterium]|jgi:hypothetical protein|nr:hypothetical protein [Candidatus Baltobacteraceae bacterium]
MNTSGDGLTDHPLGDEVLKYLIRNPDAQDTARGIAEWWVAGARNSHRRFAEVEAALDELVRKNFVIARSSKDGRTHYRLNPEQKQAIRAGLAKARNARKRRDQ